MGSTRSKSNLKLMLRCPEIELLTIIDNLSSNTSFPLRNDLCLPMKPFIWYWIQVMFPKPPAIISSINLPSQSPCIGSSASCWRGQSVAHGDQKPFPNQLQTRPQTPVNSWHTSTQSIEVYHQEWCTKIDTESPKKTQGAVSQTLWPIQWDFSAANSCCRFGAARSLAWTVASIFESRISISAHVKTQSASGFTIDKKNLGPRMKFRTLLHCKTLNTATSICNWDRHLFCKYWWLYVCKCIGLDLVGCWVGSAQILDTILWYFQAPVNLLWRDTLDHYGQ